MSTSQAIRERIAAQPAGEPFTPALFAGLGSRASIDQTLMRLTKEGFIERLGRGPCRYVFLCRCRAGGVGGEGEV